MASLVEKIALSRPDISIRFIQNNQNKLYTSGNSNVKDLIYTVFGRETAASLIWIDWKGDGISITGYIGEAGAGTLHPRIRELFSSTGATLRTRLWQGP